MRSIVSYGSRFDAAFAGGAQNPNLALLTPQEAQGLNLFNGVGGCAKCHSICGSFATVGARFQGLALLQRMLYPRNRGPRAASGPQLLTVTTGAGQTITGNLGYRDEFTITLIDADGWTRSFPLSGLKVQVDDPLLAHSEQLGKYTDRDMHDVFAYLQSLK